MELLLSFLHIQKTEPEVSRPALLKKSGASDAQLKALITKNILVAEQRPVDRLRVLPRNIHIPFELSAAQETALAESGNNLKQKMFVSCMGILPAAKPRYILN